MATLIERGRRAFAEHTRKHVWEMIGIYWNERLVSAPVVREPIEGGKFFVASSRSREEPEDIAICLNSGPLQVKLAVQR